MSSSQYNEVFFFLFFFDKVGWKQVQNHKAMFSNSTLFQLYCLHLRLALLTGFFLSLLGNPGMAGYYQTFIQALYCGLNRQYPVWVISHAGHCKVPHGMEMLEGIMNFISTLFSVIVLSP